MKIILRKIFNVLNILMAAIGVINLGKDIYPAFIKWSEFMYYLLDVVKHFRNLVLLPISLPLEWIDIIMLDWFKSYLFLGFLAYNTYNISHRVICGARSHASLINLIIEKDRIRIFLHILVSIFLWPILTFDLVKHYYEGKYDNKNNVYTLWGKYIFGVIFATVLLIFLNWIINQINA
ncbi:MAG: hypothetical protein KA210_07845 [Bacteroidia bacterium]|nr:hypothetical protein [Bacteroidia bacterium]